MQGLELCRKYYEEYAAPLLAKRFGNAADRFAAGLAGAGSDCLGFDDEISCDHDFGPAFCIWLTDEDYDRYSFELRGFYRGLSHTFMGVTRKSERQAEDRVGVMTIGDFYARFTGCRGVPENEIAWLRIPEHLLCAATSGAVFADSLGEFSRIREKLLQFYPEDIRLKKIAARLFTMGQAGQYNYPRSAKRGDFVACMLALSEFVKAALSCLHLMNKKYAPYYKWLCHSAKNLPRHSEIAKDIELLCEKNIERGERIEKICAAVAKELRKESLSDVSDTFLVPHAESVMKRIRSENLRRLGITVG